MFKKLKKFLLAGVVIYAMLSMTMGVAMAVTNGSIYLGGSRYAVTKDWTTVTKKTTSSKSMYLAYVSHTLSNSYYSKTNCKVMVQAHPSSNKETDLYAYGGCRVYDFDLYFNDDLVNNVPAGHYTAIRFAMDPTDYYTTFKIQYDHI